MRAKRFKKAALWFTAVLIIFNAGIILSGKTYFYQAVYHNFADIDDYKIFSNRVIEKSDQPAPWPLSEQTYNKAPLPEPLQAVLEKYNSIAFLVIKDDSLIHEQYWDGYDAGSFSNSFSVAKSYVSALIGIAIREGKIAGVDQKAGAFLPEFNEGEKKHITIKHLLMMSSGLDWNESYADPFSVTTEAYYGNDLVKAIAGLKVESAPGVEFSYKSGDTQILGFILEKATGMSLSQYAQEKLWKPMGAGQNALWSLDRDNGHEKAYCCINSNARDFARLGYLYLHKGNWKGKQLIDSGYVNASLTPNGLKFKNEICDFYGYQWWLIPDYKGEEIFYARGILGQLIVVFPERNMITVRLGARNGEKEKNHFGLVFQIADGLKHF